LYDTASGKHIEDLRQPRYGGFPVKSLRWHPYDHHILYGATCNGMIYALNVKSHTCTAVVSGMLDLAVVSGMLDLAVCCHLI